MKVRRFATAAWPSAINCRNRRGHALHDLLRLYLLANASVAPELRIKPSGHSNERVHEGCSHHAMEVLEAAMAKLRSLDF